MRTRSVSSGGQAAMVDAILFMTLMLIASAVVIGSARPPGSELSDLQRYTADYAQTVLSAELSGVEYKDVEGRGITLGESGRSIGQLLCDESSILSNGIGRSDFSEYEARILAAGKSIIRPDMDFAISCNDGTVFISANASCISELPGTHSASQMIVWTGDLTATPVTMTVYVWVV